MKGHDQDACNHVLSSIESRPIELDDFRDTPSHDSIDPMSSWEAPRELESQPLLEAGIGPSTTTIGARRHSNIHFNPASYPCRRRRCSSTMGRVKVACYIDKLAVTLEPGLTDAQLMLTNHDLKPGSFLQSIPKLKLC